MQALPSSLGPLVLPVQELLRRPVQGPEPGSLLEQLLAELDLPETQNGVPEAEALHREPRSGPEELDWAGYAPEAVDVGASGVVNTQAVACGDVAVT